MATIDYTNECDNDDHNPGCICGVPFFNAFNAKTRAPQTPKPDPYRPAEPNKLYFKKLEPTFVGDEQIYFWQLTNSEGRRLASSHDIFCTKLEAIQNAIAVLGRELRHGDHRVVDDLDNQMVLDEFHRIEDEVNSTEKKAV